MNTWLEIRAYFGDSPAIAIEPDILKRIGSLSNVFHVAESASSESNTGTIWDYARRLESQEFHELLALLRFQKVQDDARSIVYQSIVSYKNSRYAVNLFVDKGQ